MLNHINIMGRIVATPELRKTKNDTAVASFRIACDRDYTEGTDFFDCVAWRKTGEFVTKYFEKGSPICIAGRLQTRDWEDKEGNKRRAYEIIVENAYFAGGKKKENAEESPALEELANDDGELPF